MPRPDRHCRSPLSLTISTGPLRNGKCFAADYDDYEAFKAAHARNGANILRVILDECGVAKPTADEACRLVVRHEVGGDCRSDLLKDADSISYFEVNLPFYHEREGWEETKRSFYLGLSASLRAGERDREEHDIRRRGINAPVKGSDSTSWPQR